VDNGDRLVLGEWLQPAGAVRGRGHGVVSQKKCFCVSLHQARAQVQATASLWTLVARPVQAG
jgi:hypothetical protein